MCGVAVTRHLNCFRHDTIDHIILFSRLDDVFGIRGIALEWLHWFVTGRMQYIAVGSQSSVICPCISGVRQGSVLGTLLLAAYASPSDDVIAAHRMQQHQYADDLMPYLALTASQLGDLSPVSECVDDVTRRFLENASLLNPSKTDTVIFGRQQRLTYTDKSSSIATAGFQVALSYSVRLVRLLARRDA
jgi:Reverse transcriptase (RNA-dependent DNA polymerase)